MVFSKFEKTDYPLAKLSLEVGKEVNIPIEIFDGENQIVIKNLKLLNSAEDSEMKEFFKNDIVFPYVEYSCDDEISVMFCLLMSLTNLSRVWADWQPMTALLLLQWIIRTKAI